MTQLEEIAPRNRELVYNLVKEAGLDVSDWANYKRGAAHAASNPKYCYEWSFVEDDKLVVLNLWHKGMRELDGVVSSSFNMRSLAHQVARLRDDPLRKNDAKPIWEKRALKMDSALQLAARKKLPVRVIVCEGEIHGLEHGDDESSRVHKRLLDPLPWAVTRYDLSTGDVTLTQGASPIPYVDQFSDDLSTPGQPAARRKTEGEAFIRNSEVRREVPQRAQGICELCGSPGFRTATGQVYLETHHVVPLSEDGADHISNVVALCPNDHRRAHHSVDRAEIRVRLLGIIASSRS